MMNRSEINQIIKYSLQFMEQCRFCLPPFATWTVDDWKTKGSEYDNIRINKLGWDVSDYGFGDFSKCGIVAFTIRLSQDKPFAEKLLILDKGQELPMHRHPNKTEDLINRGGSDFCIRLYGANQDDSISDSDVDVLMDGRMVTLNAGSVLRIKPGGSITLTPNLYHTFWAESGKTLFGEVTMANNDHLFYGRQPGSTRIHEDCPPKYHLSHEYPAHPDYL